MPADDSHSSLSALLTRLAALPRLTREVPAIEGTFKDDPEDFLVEELPAYLPTGSGEHLYLWIEKRDLNTQDAVQRLARALGTRPDGAGYAGLKDRRAITRQWLSFHHTATPTAQELEVEGVRVLEVSRHANKLRTGHLRGNRFTIRLKSVPPAHDAHAARALAEIAAAGLPNYYGNQRFGTEGRNLRSAWSWIVDAGRPPQKPFLRKLFVSTLQSALFNAWLAERIEAGQFAQVLAGDVLRKEDSGGIFTSDDRASDQPRLEGWEISVTGPMFGARMRSAEAEAGEQEASVLARYGVTMEQLQRVERAGEGTRRPARVRVTDVEQRREGDDLWLSFCLPKGSYATVVLAELTKSQALTLGDDA